MLSYRGKFRVLYEVDKDMKVCEFTYVPCNIRKGANICRHSDAVLSAYIPSAIIAKRLLNEHSDIFTPFQIGDCEGVLLFNETDIDRAAVILKPRVLGKGLNPRPKRKIVLSGERKTELSDRMKQLHSRFIGEKQRKK